MDWPLNWVDLVLLGVIALSALAGFLRGLARELLGLAAWVAAALLASRVYGNLLGFAGRWLQDALVADTVCFLVAFVVILIGLSLLANLLSRLVRVSLFGGVDRILGLGFGLVRGAALLVLAYIVLAFALPQTDWPDPLRQSRSLPYLHAGAAFALARTPARWRPNLPAAWLPEAGLPQAGQAHDQESF